MDAEHEAPFDYSAVTADDVRQGVEGAIGRSEEMVQSIAAVPDAQRTVENTLLPLEEIRDVLSRAGGHYGFLSQVSPDAKVRGAAHEYEEQLDTYATGLGFREELAQALRTLDALSAERALDGEAARLLEFELRDYRRNGVDLDAPTRRHLQDLKERLVALGIAFRRNIDEYEDAILVGREGLAGLPESYIERLQREGNGAARYRVSLDYPELGPFLENAQDGSLREALFRKNYNRAADENVAVLEEAIALRDEVARTLSYPSWAHYVTEIRVAGSPEVVEDFLRDLEARVRPKAEADMARLQKVHGGDFAIWDWRYLTQRVLREEYDVDPFAVAEYFPLEAVLEGLFDAYQALAGVRFVPHPNAKVWHEDVRFFDIVDEASGEEVAHFYMDLHPRPDKFGHAAAFTLQGGRTLSGGAYQSPVSAIVANFTKPAEASPSLLQHSEVVTLFHEFGHILHQTLTRTRFLRFSGTSVERDFVEAPSQMLEHWCWEPKVLRGFTRHYRTGDPIPEDLVRRMTAAKHVSSGIATLRQIYFSRLDLAYHGPGTDKDTDSVARDLHTVTGFPFPEDTHFQAGFGHLFGYDAGYYGYLWSKVSGDDMFTRFEAAGLRDPEVGRDYRQRILERGGSVDGDLLVRGFLGRDPTPAAFLRDLGLNDGSE